MQHEMHMHKQTNKRTHRATRIQMQNFHFQKFTNPSAQFFSRVKQIIKKLMMLYEKIFVAVKHSRRNFFWPDNSKIRLYTIWTNNVSSHELTNWLREEKSFSVRKIKLENNNVKPVYFEQNAKERVNRRHNGQHEMHMHIQTKKCKHRATRIQM